MRMFYFPQILVAFILLVIAISISVLWMQENTSEEDFIIEQKSEPNITKQSINQNQSFRDNSELSDSYDNQSFNDEFSDPGAEAQTLQRRGVSPESKKFDLEIFTDEQSNYISLLSDADGGYKEYVFSSHPIYRPSHYELNYGIQGCAISGVYVDYDATLVVVSKNPDGFNQYGYRCAYRSDWDNYVVEKAPVDEIISQSIRQEIGDEEIVDMHEYGGGDNSLEPEIPLGVSQDELYQDEPEF